ncbi:MAG: efflux RND transporter periplasmic adaptor subunit [Xanthomonadales bacterium]|nr:efflux RND transporter periplasmic adaptor subunit [Xanthomonadales bacterium]
MPNPRLSFVPWLLAMAAAVHAQGPGGAMPPTPVETARPRLESVVDQATAVGTLRANEAVVLRPEVAGRIEAIHFEEGARVGRGDLLFALDGAIARAEVQEWEATVAQSRREAERASDLIARKLAAQSDADAKRSTLAIDEARLASAQTRLAKTEIRAPFAGQVGLRQVSVGEYVNVGDALVSLAQTDTLKLDFRIPETQATRAAAGQAVRIAVDAFPGEEFAGKVYAVDPQVDVATRSVMLRATLANPGGKLRPGQFANVRLALAERANALTIPEQALWPQGGKQFVYVVRAGKAELAEIRIGKRSAGRVEVLTGLAAEDEFVVAGQMRIFPGAAVAPLATKPPAAPTPAPRKG